MKKLAVIFVTATLLINAMAPTLAYAATYLQGAQVNANTLTQNAYVAVTYYDSKGKQKLEKGWIYAIDETAFKIRSRAIFGKKTIAYDKVVSVIMSEEVISREKQINEVDRFIQEMKKQEASVLEIEQAIQKLNQTITVMDRGQLDLSKIPKGWYIHIVYTSKGVKGTATVRSVEIDSSHISIKEGLLKTRKIAYNDIDTLLIAKSWRDIERYQKIGATYDVKVRVQAPPISKKRMDGRLIKMTQDTLVIQRGRRFYQVPLSSIKGLRAALTFNF